MKHRLTSRILLWSLFAACALLAVFSTHAFAQTEQKPNTNIDTANDEETQQIVNDLQSQISEKKQHIDELYKQRKVYEDTISAKQQEASSLSNQIATFNGQISKTETDIDITEEEIGKLQLEIEDVSNRIDEKEKDIRDRKAQLGDVLRELQEMGKPTPLGLALLNKTFSDFFSRVSAIEQVEGELKAELDDVESLKEDLSRIQSSLGKKQEAFVETKDRLEVQKQDVVTQRAYKDNLLSETQDNEELFQSLLEDLQREQQAANVEVVTLEYQIRQRIEGGEIDLSNFIPGVFSWPVDPSNGISATFHDPTYPFRKYFEHSGIDIRTSQGTAIIAPADGFVVRAKDAGMGYSYILIAHDESLSTLFGHVSSIAIQEEQYVVRGQVIGYSGGTPGTPGAGSFSTGAHLHFEVRKDGIPVDPMEYLP